MPEQNLEEHFIEAIEHQRKQLTEVAKKIRSIYDDIYEKTKDDLEELMEFIEELDLDIDTQVNKHIYNKKPTYKPKIKKFRLDNRPKQYRARSNLR